MFLICNQNSGFYLKYARGMFFICRPFIQVYKPDARQFNTLPDQEHIFDAFWAVLFVQASFHFSALNKSVYIMLELPALCFGCPYARVVRIVRPCKAFDLCSSFEISKLTFLNTDPLIMSIFEIVTAFSISIST